MTSTPDELRAAAMALGADPDDAATLARAERKISRSEAERALGDDTESVMHARPNSRASSSLPPDVVRRGSRLSREAAARQLGERTFRESMTARHIAGEWRSRTLARFQTKAGRVWLVKFLETQLTGTETEVPPNVIQAIDHALRVDRMKVADCPTLASVGYARDTYQAIVDQLRRNGKLPAQPTPRTA